MSQIKKYLKRLALVKQILAKRDYFKKKKIVKTLEAGFLMDMLSKEEREHWIPRIKLVLESEDNIKINYTQYAGSVNKDYNLVMHNGLIIDPLSYYGLPVLEMLSKNKGVHEPQEEFAFQESLKEIPDEGVMIELGAYWAFYSMWFNAEIKNSKNYMIEPLDIDSGIKNFKLNRMSGSFTKAYISDYLEKSNERIEIPTICIDGFVEEKEIKFVDMLHSDIQGYEYKMLLGAEKLLTEKRVGYIFISTHSQELHYQCMDHLKLKGYQLVCSADIDESYSYDGLLVFKNPHYKGVGKIDISKRKIFNKEV